MDRKIWTVNNENLGCLDFWILQPVREAVSYRRLFTAGWLGVREKHCFRLEIYDRLRANEQTASLRLWLVEGCIVYNALDLAVNP